MLTKKQKNLLIYINEKLKSDGVSPSYDEMRVSLNLKSKSGIHRLISALEERGFIKRLAHKARALEVVKLPENASAKDLFNNFKPSPTKYRKLLSKTSALAISGAFELTDQVPALRFVVFVDRLYELQIPLRSSGSVAITEVFSQSMIAGGYRKKYLRAVSRLGALSEL